MEAQELVRIDLQLPASALDSLARLAEQLRLLTAAVNSPPEQPARQAQEYGENTFFDTSRFQSLQPGENTPEPHTAPPMEQGLVSVMDVEAAVPVRSAVREAVPPPESAAREAAGYEEEPAQAGPPGNDAILNGHAVQRVRGEAVEDPGEIPAVRADMGQTVPEPPAAGPGPEHQPPEADRAGASTDAWDMPVPHAQGDVRTRIESPVGAGVVVTAEPEMPQSRWTGITEELVTPGPAPLTAEAVSWAFQRDGRRYDNGFPLY